MVLPVRFKRGTAEQNDLYVGLEGELTIDVTNRRIRLHDGITPGGISFSRLEDVSALVDQALTSIDFSLDPQNDLLLIEDQFYGWKDITSGIDVKGRGVNDPPWTLFRNGIYAYTFEAGKTMEFWTSFHLNHDYALGTKIYPHVHWTVNGTATGTVRWGFEYTVAKGHQQSSGSVFGPTSIVYSQTQVNSDDQFKHFVTETSEAQAIPADFLEPDSIIMMRIFRDGTNDTYPASVFGITADIHYQAARMSTKNKSPNFYV